MKMSKVQKIRKERLLQRDQALKSQMPDIAKKVVEQDDTNNRKEDQMVQNE